MSISEKLNSLLQIKSDLKTVLSNKGLITSSTTFEQYPDAIRQLQKPVEMVTLTIKFDNDLYASVSGRMYYASSGSGSKKGYLLVNGVDYYDLVLGERVIYGSTQYDVSCQVQVPKGELITVQAYMLTGDSKSNPINRRYYDESNANRLSSDPDVKTITPTEDSTLTFKAVADMVLVG